MVVSKQIASTNVIATLATLHSMIARDACPNASAAAPTSSLEFITVPFIVSIIIVLSFTLTTCFGSKK